MEGGRWNGKVKNEVDRMNVYFPETLPVERIEEFVSEYLFDFDAMAACQRIGFAADVAFNMAQHFLKDPGTQRAIREAQETDDIPVGMKGRIVNLLVKEANYHGDDSSASARVSALKQLSNIYGLDNEANKDEGLLIENAVMVVPAIASVEDWEQQAEEAQDALLAAN